MKFVDTRAASCARFSAITGGGTTPARAASNAAAAAAAAAAASWHCAAVSIIHTTYGAADSAIDIDEGPAHAVLVSASITAPNAAPADPSCAASACHAAADSIRDAEPRPAYMRPELISGGSS